MKLSGDIERSWVTYPNISLSGTLVFITFALLRLSIPSTTFHDANEINCCIAHLLIWCYYFDFHDLIQKVFIIFSFLKPGLINSFYIQIKAWFYFHSGSRLKIKTMACSHNINNRPVNGTIRDYDICIIIR